MTAGMGIAIGVLGAVALGTLGLVLGLSAALAELIARVTRLEAQRRETRGAE